MITPVVAYFITLSSVWLCMIHETWVLLSITPSSSWLSVYSCNSRGREIYNLISVMKSFTGNFSFTFALHLEIPADKRTQLNNHKILKALSWRVMSVFTRLKRLLYGQLFYFLIIKWAKWEFIRFEKLNCLAFCDWCVNSLEFLYTSNTILKRF